MTTHAEPALEPRVTPSAGGPPRSILAPGLRPLALALLVVAGAALTSLSIAFHGDRFGAGFDYSFTRHFADWLGPDVAPATLHATDQPLTVPLLILVVLGALLARRWDMAVFAAASPILAILLTEVVLKPLVGRYLTYPAAGLAEPTSGAFPSGHETALAALTVELTVLVLRAPIAAGWRALVAAVLAAWTAIGAIGLAVNLYHYATDAIGGICVAIVVVLGVALAVDAGTSRLSSPAARGRPRTSRAA